MQTPLAFLKFVAKAALNVVGFGVAGDFAMEVIPKIAQDVWSSWGKDRTEAARKDEIQALVQASPEAVKQKAKEITREVAGDRGKDVQDRIETFITLIPMTVRQSLRGKHD